MDANTDFGVGEPKGVGQGSDGGIRWSKPLNLASKHQRKNDMQTTEKKILDRGMGFDRGAILSWGMVSLSPPPHIVQPFYVNLWIKESSKYLHKSNNRPGMSTPLTTAQTMRKMPQTRVSTSYITRV